MKTLIRKYDYGGTAPYTKNPNTWGSGMSLSSVVPAVDLSYIDKDKLGNTGQTGKSSGIFGSILGSIGGAEGVSSFMNGITSLIQPGSLTPSNPLVSVGGDMMKNIAGNIASKIGISANPASGLIGAATDLGVGMLGKAFGKNTNYSDTGSQIANQVAGVASMFGPIGMAAGAAIKLANMFGSKEVEGVTHNEETQNTLGSSYGLSQYDRDTKNFGLFGRGQAKRYEQEVNKMRGILARADDVAEDTKNDKLRQQGSIEGINSRNRMELVGGFRSLHVKKGGVLFNMDFVDNCMKMKNGGNIIEKPNKNMTLEQFMKYISDTGRMSNDYDYESFYNDKGMFNKWLENELLHPSSAHFYDKYKKPNHITFSEESIYSNENMKGGRWINEDGKTYFIPTDINIKNAGGEDKLREYFKIHEPGIILSFPDNDTLYMKNGGTFNIIPSGALHKERHRLEKDNPIFGDDRTTNKGIPVIEIKDNGEIKQHAEIERDEIIFRKECTDKLLELMNSDDEDAAFKAGELLIDEIFNKTHDNTGMIRRIKVDKK